MAIGKIMYFNTKTKHGVKVHKGVLKLHNPYTGFSGSSNLQKELPFEAPVDLLDPDKDQGALVEFEVKLGVAKVKKKFNKNE